MNRTEAMALLIKGSILKGQNVVGFIQKTQRGGWYYFRWHEHRLQYSVMPGEWFGDRGNFYMVEEFQVATDHPDYSETLRDKVERLSSKGWLSLEEVHELQRDGYDPFNPFR